ncbi:hypothetical protein EZV62_010486 [Acer yangbiense]|uniref:Protein transport protein sec16 n=1 Tax=Acer yangbiense TaxID=1000413 RepID=A0A5C7I4T4_9ROSI|nr:hypothetical protein EZV62_010486 [Acer yangbiense]
MPKSADPDLVNESSHQPNEFSLSQLWILGGSFGQDLNSIEAGWQETHIRRHVNRLRKHSSNDVRRLVKHLVRKWKDIVDELVKLNPPARHEASALMGNNINHLKKQKKRVGLGTCDYLHTLCQQSFPGPLVGGNFGNKELNKWIDERIANCESPNDYENGEVMSLLFSLLKIAYPYYGKLRSPFGTDPVLKNLPAEAQIQATTLELYGDTLKQMAIKQLVAGSPLRTLCLLIAGQPADVFSNDAAYSIIPASVNTFQQPVQSGANFMLDNWEENLAIITANRTKGDELLVVHLGDC